MTINTASYVDESSTMIKVESDDGVKFIPVDESEFRLSESSRLGNGRQHYQCLLRAESSL